MKRILAMLMVGAIGPAMAQTSPYTVGERVQLEASMGRWQDCTVVDPGHAEAVTRLSCDPYDDGVYRRAGGMYTETITSKGIRKLGANAVSPAVAQQAPAPQAAAAPPAMPSRAAPASPYSVGERVQLYASAGRWQDCTIVDPGHAEAVTRMSCDPYDDGVYKRAGGMYTESVTSTGIRKVGAAPR